MSIGTVFFAAYLINKIKVKKKIFKGLTRQSNYFQNNQRNDYVMQLICLTHKK